MGTSLAGSSLTLNNATLTEDQIKILTEYKDITVNVGDTVYLDGIECLCIATGVTIQGSALTRIAIDKNYDLGYYQKYVGKVVNGTEINQITRWRWGGYNTLTDNTSQEVGYGLKNTNICLSKTVNYTGGSSDNNNYPLMWMGVKDFRASHSDKWFVPSLKELVKNVYPNKSKLSFDTSTGGSSTSNYWSSSENAKSNSFMHEFNSHMSYGAYKDGNGCTVRLCRAF